MQEMQHKPQEKWETTDVDNEMGRLIALQYACGKERECIHLGSRTTEFLIYAPLALM